MSRPPTIEYLRVARVDYTTGRGIEHDPVRRVSAYFDEQGTLLFERDLWAATTRSTTADAEARRHPGEPI